MANHTPVKVSVVTETDDTPTLKRNADRSARRKSTRMLIERTVLGNISDNDNEDEDIAQHIYNSEEEDDLTRDSFEAETSVTVDAPLTPSKRGRGRPKGSKNRVRSPTPPLNGHEVVDVQFTPSKRGRGRPKGSKTRVRSPTPPPNGDEVVDAPFTPSKRGRGRPKGSKTRVRSQTPTPGGHEVVDVPFTPSKRGRGRPKGSKNRLRSPTPPLDDLPPHEKYFFQNRGGRANTSDNNLSSLALLDHEEYFSLVRSFTDPHVNDLNTLQELHAKSFNQWQFELSQDFNICVYGWGSKRSLLMRFADHIYKSQINQKSAKIVVVNGYVHTLTIRDVLNTIASAVSGPDQKLGSQPAEMLESIIALLEEDKTQDVTVIVHSIDRMPLRRPASQVILSRLSAHPQVHLVTSADHPSFPLLWDSSLRSSYNFVFHNCTTFQPYIAEVDVVEEVHELLGRSGRRVGGKEGVSFVLKSLPENAKNLFRVLIGEQLAAMDDSHADGLGGFDDDDDDENEQRIGSSKRTDPGVEYQVLYQKAVEEFICSNEMNFRTLLKEFHDHQMIQSRKDALGTEMLSVPFRKEELETILEDIMS
ncbi:uncharacterized protein BP5553_07287 [Venustampulla echinocandica]|uniref:Origin recognition complex subunit 2 n=1 Tax=Venustampulla echinocandica TaxID=2656787 RepID=A0A370TJ27_9HELO|nr:uncharacterized protein BP5553_07287 [Venustampulla echinocandica]RDL35356.1 hypothetical protein BP5553_07287 [Venustampulla echinocandica]